MTTKKLQSSVIKDWQKFCARLAAVAGCIAVDDAVEESVKQMAKEA